jgi:pSer/pThr/pTyr-binding forkhead associated (FHA) protein
MSLELVVVAGPDKGRTFTLNVGKDLILGRSAQAHYQISDLRTSRNHCVIALEGDEVRVICNGGSGGTMVNGRKVTQQTLKPGDVIQVGDTQLRFQHGDAPLDVALAQSAGAKPEAKPADKGVRLASLVGKTLARFDITMAIGGGRSSTVFHATDTKDDRPVALKVLNPEFSADKEEVERFIRAIETMLPLKHPNLIRLYGAGKTGQYCWVAMEYVAGENLTQVIDAASPACWTGSTPTVWRSTSPAPWSTPTSIPTFRSSTATSRRRTSSATPRRRPPSSAT